MWIYFYSFLDHQPFPWYKTPWNYTSGGKLGSRFRAQNSGVHPCSRGHPAPLFHQPFDHTEDAIAPSAIRERYRCRFKDPGNGRGEKIWGCGGIQRHGSYKQIGCAENPGVVTEQQVFRERTATVKEHSPGEPWHGRGRQKPSRKQRRRTSDPADGQPERLWKKAWRTWIICLTLDSVHTFFLGFGQRLLPCSSIWQAASSHLTLSDPNAKTL